MEDEDEKPILTMDSEVHDTQNRHSETTEIENSEEKSKLFSSILPQLGDSQLIEGSPPLVAEEVTLSVGTEMLMDTAAEVAAAEGDRKGIEVVEITVTEDLVEGSVPIFSEQDVTELFGVQSALHIPEDMAGNDISFDFDDPELMPSNSLSITQDEPFFNEEEIKILENDGEGSEDMDRRFTSGADFVEAVVTSDVPIKMDYDIVNCKNTQIVEDGVGNCLPISDNLQSFDTQSSIFAKLGEGNEAIEKGQAEVMEEEQNVGVESLVDSTLGQKDDVTGTVGDLAPEPDNVEVSQQSLVPKELNVEDDEVMGEEDVMVTEAESVHEMEENHIKLMDGLEDVSCTPTKDDDGEESMEEDDPPTADNEMERDTDVVDVPAPDTVGIVAGKRKRGKNSKVSTRSSSRKTIGEDVCFICFDGGELVLCDRRGCPKAYHPSCVNRDEAFFRAKGRWNCGWHLCSICEKNGYYTCYTCTFSLCKVCTKDAVILCVRGNKGFCETCMRTVLLIENNEALDNEDKVDFDDKSSWEYLFKDYWTDLKKKLSITPDELALAKNPRKGSDAPIGKDESNEEYIDVNNGDFGSDSSENLEDRKRKKRLSRKKSKRQEKTQGVDLPNTLEIASVPRGWASQELLEFVMHMKDGDDSILSQFDVQALLLEYIKTNKLRDPRRKSLIICDARLENLFGKVRVGHFEMLKLLESHFLIKDDTHIDDVQGTVVDTDVNQVERDETNDSPIKGGSREKKRKSRKKGYDRGPQSNLNDYAAIDNHNINLIYLRRKLVEDVLEDVDKFHDTVAGTFVRIRITGNNQKQDLYRLVQVIGTTKVSEPYRVGKRTTNYFLEVLNLDKTEVVAIDTISNQEFTEDECKRLRQSIKCGLINRLTVGDILHKTTIMHAARVNDWLEAEVQRLSHLRDRASEKGRKKELRECVEKLQLLRTPEERRRRMDEIPEIHSDPKMDPDYESEDDSDKDTTPGNYLNHRASSGFSRNEREPVSPGRGNLTDAGSGSRRLSDKNWEFSRSNSGKDFPNKSEDKASVSRHLDESNLRNQVLHQSSTLDKIEPEKKSETVVKSDSFSSPASNPPVSVTNLPKINESEKSWFYKDPSGKTQGPFSVVQLRKWSNNRYFPNDLKVWRDTEDEDKSILLKDALDGKFHQQSQTTENPLPSPNPVKETNRIIRVNDVDQNIGNKWKKSSSPTVQVQVSKVSTDRLVNNLPSPTPVSITPTSVGVNQQDVSSTHLGKMNPAAPQSVSSTLPGKMNPAAPQSFSSTLPGNMNPAAPQYVSSTLPGNMNPAAPQYVSSSLPGNMNPAAPQQPTSSTVVITPTPVGINSQDVSSALTGNMNPAAPQPLPEIHPNQIKVESSQPPEIHANLIPSLPMPQTQGQPYVQVPGPNYSNPCQPSPWAVQNNQYPPGPRTDGSNMGWVGPGPGPMPANQPMMGWVGPGPIAGPVPVPVPIPVPANGNMNWNMAVQGPMNPGWVGPGFMQPGMMNPGWFPQMGNPSGWFPPNTNQPQTWGPPQPGGNTTGPPPPVQGVPPGPARPAWNGPPSNSGTRGNDQQNNGNRYSGQRDRGSSSGYNNNNNSNRICMFHRNGFCRKGANCYHPHS